MCTTNLIRTAWCKSETRTPGARKPGTRNPGCPSKFKCGTWDPSKVNKWDSRTHFQSLKVGLDDPLQSLKVGLPRLHHSLINSFFLE